MLALHGIGIGAVVQVTPKSVFVGATAIGTARPGSLQITNVGLDPRMVTPLRVSSLSVISSDPAWTLQTPSPLDIGEPGASAIVLRNEKGAVLSLSGRQVGLIANLDLSGMAISLR